MALFNQRSFVVVGFVFLLALPLGGVDWRLGDQVYRNVEIREVTERAVIIAHSKGISQILLKDLPPEAQEHFGYDPAAAQEAAARLRQEQALARARKKAIDEALATARASGGGTGGEGVDGLAKVFGQPPVIRREVDLRPELRELGLFSKSQGRRPSCSVFAVVGALEFLSSKRGDAIQFSEDYAIWATRQYLAEERGGRSDAYADGDAGFRLIDVIRALDRYGLATWDAMPNTFGTGMESIDRPDTELLRRAQENFRLRAARIDAPGDPSESVNRLTHCINAGQPVVIGVAWPHQNTIQSAPMISRQTPIGLHAVTLVGYRADENGANQRFVFKNSWGPDWGSAGYGWITADYLKKHLVAAYLLELGDDAWLP